MVEREFFIDVSRLIWRVWTGRLPTGIDRVCLAYLEHFGSRAQAVVQKGFVRRILSPSASDRLFALLLAGGSQFRYNLLKLGPTMLFTSAGNGDCAGKIYFNIGHTGLEDQGLMGWLKRRRMKPVYLIHDLIPLSHPDFCRAGESEKHAQRMVNVLGSAAGIIGNSQVTLDELASFATKRGLAMPQQIAAWISGHDIPDRIDPAQRERPYFVTVGTIEGRKNHVLLLQIWLQLIARLGKAAPQLLIIGQRGWEADHALAMLDRNDALYSHVIEMGDCSDLELATLISGARALLMPSFAEGFGLPVVEALHLGTPVIASDLPVFREIAGDIPEYADPTDGAGWQRCILDFLGDSPARQRQIADLQGYRAPDWKGHFAAVEAWVGRL